MATFGASCLMVRHMQPISTDDRFVDNAESRHLAGGVSQRTIDRWTAAGQFPKQITLGGTKRRSLREILTWRAARIAARDLQAEEGAING